MALEVFYTGIVQGLILAILAFGIMIPFRFLDLPDLTVEGAYPLGGAVSASLLISGVPSYLSILGGIIAGGALGFSTAQLIRKLNVNSLLAGIILSTMVYSINLRVMGKPNIALFELNNLHLNILSLSIIVGACVIPFTLFLQTDFGLRFRTIGSNVLFAVNQGIRVNQYTSLGFVIAGALFGLAGSLMVQIQEFMDVSMGIGIVIHGLASLMIGESITGNDTIKRQLAAPIIGSLIYQQIQGLVLSLGLAPTDLKLFTGCILLTVSTIKKGNSDVN